MPSRRPWLRLYTAWRTDPRVQSLPAEVRAAFINLLCLAGESSRPGYIEESPGKPYGHKALAKAVNVHVAALDRILNTLIEHDVGGLTPLEEGGLLMSKWGSNQPVDATAQERMLRYRAKLDERNTPVTVTGESRVEKSRVDNPPVVPPRGTRTHKVPGKEKTASAECRAALLTRFGPALGVERVEEAIADALAHKAVDKWKDTDRYVTNWVRKEAGGQNGPTPRQSGATGFDNSPEKYR